MTKGMKFNDDGAPTKRFEMRQLDRFAFGPRQVMFGVCAPGISGAVLAKPENLIAHMVGRKLDYGALFAYLFRRFGYPQSDWDGKSRLVSYLLTTPADDLVLQVTPRMSPGPQDSIIAFMADDSARRLFSPVADQWRGYVERMLAWIRATYPPPTWIGQAHAECVRQSLDQAYWRGAPEWMATLYGVSRLIERQSPGDPDLPSRIAGWKRWLNRAADAYAGIEPLPHSLSRGPSWRQWPDDDPMKPYAEALQATLDDIRRPVRIDGVRCANAFGEVDVGPDGDKLWPPLSVGHAFGAVANAAPHKTTLLQQAILAAGDGDANAGLVEVLRRLGVASDEREPVPKNWFEEY